MPTATVRTPVLVSFCLVHCNIFLVSRYFEHLRMWIKAQDWLSVRWYCSEHCRYAARVCPSELETICENVSRPDQILSCSHSREESFRYLDIYSVFILDGSSWQEPLTENITTLENTLSYQHWHGIIDAMWSGVQSTGLQSEKISKKQAKFCL